MKTIKAFTLIELLVVVLIIGILASIAIPQYQLAVAKSRYATLIPLVDSIWQAQQLYFLANGTYAQSFSDLDIGLNQNGHAAFFPWGGCWLQDDYKYTYCKHALANISYLKYYSGKRSCIAYGADKTALNYKICKLETNDDNPSNGNWYTYP